MGVPINESAAYYTVQAPLYAKPMKIHLETSELNLISHYGAGSISVNGTPYEQNILITPNKVVENWFQGDLSQLNRSHFDVLLENTAESESPEIVLLGTGKDHVFPDMKLLVELQTAGLALEVMNTRAACRTYSVLVGEQRAVAAALIQFEE